MTQLTMLLFGQRPCTLSRAATRPNLFAASQAISQYNCHWDRLVFCPFLTCSHSLTTRDSKPCMVLHLGSKIICARDVTWSVESVPSVPWTNTDAPSLRKKKVERSQSVNEQNASQGRMHPNGCRHIPWTPAVLP